MKLISRLIFVSISNLVAVMAADYFIGGFDVSLEPANLLFVVGLLTLFNVFVRPILKFLFTPLIILTLGLFTIVINGVILYSVDILSENITISGLTPLLYATLLISFLNIIINLSAKSLYRKA